MKLHSYHPWQHKDSAIGDERWTTTSVITGKYPHREIPGTKWVLTKRGAPSPIGSSDCSQRWPAVQEAEAVVRSAMPELCPDDGGQQPCLPICMSAKDKCQLLPLGRNNPWRGHSHPGWQESFTGSAGKTLGSWWGAGRTWPATCHGQQCPGAQPGHWGK